MKAVITVIGNDKVGIIAKVSALLSDCNVNILDITQTIMQDMFTMIMLADTAESSLSADEILGKLTEAGEEMGLSIRFQHEDVFNSMHRI